MIQWDHCCQRRSEARCWIVGSHTRWELTTWADFQLCLHRLVMSTGCKSSHSGFLDVSRSNGELTISGWMGQLSCLIIFSTSLSVAAFLRRAGVSMLESTGSHVRGVERRVPEMRQSLLFRCCIMKEDALSNCKPIYFILLTGVHNNIKWWNTHWGSLEQTSEIIVTSNNLKSNS